MLPDSDGVVDSSTSHHRSSSCICLWDPLSLARVAMQREKKEQKEREEAEKRALLKVRPLGAARGCMCRCMAQVRWSSTVYGKPSGVRSRRSALLLTCCATNSWCQQEERMTHDTKRAHADVRHLAK